MLDRRRSLQFVADSRRSRSLPHSVVRKRSPSAVCSLASNHVSVVAAPYHIHRRHGSNKASGIKTLLRRTALRSREDTRLSACSPMPSAASNTPPGSKPGQQVLDDGMGLAQRLCGEHVANVHAVLASHDVIGVAKGSRRWRGTAPPTKRSIWYASSAGRTAHARLDRHRDCQPRLRSRENKLTHRTESTKPDTSYLGDLAPKRCHDQSMPTDGVRFGGRAGRPIVLGLAGVLLLGVAYPPLAGPTQQPLGVFLIPILDHVCARLLSRHVDRWCRCHGGGVRRRRNPGRLRRRRLDRSADRHGHLLVRGDALRRSNEVAGKASSRPRCLVRCCSTSSRIRWFRSRFHLSA